MWTDADTQTSFACITETYVQEPSAASLKPDQLAQLVLCSGVVAFEQFPNSEHTGANIRNWIRDVAAAKGVSLEHDVTGITPDGAADGQCALNLMDELNEKTDTCDLHRLQRSVLFSIGLAGAHSKNAPCKALLRKKSRAVTLSKQSCAVSSDIRASQSIVAVRSNRVLSEYPRNAYILVSLTPVLSLPLQLLQTSRRIRSLRRPPPRLHDGEVHSCSSSRIICCIPCSTQQWRSTRGRTAVRRTPSSIKMKASQVTALP